MEFLVGSIFFAYICRMIEEILDRYDVEFLKVDGYDSAIIGVDESNVDSYKLIYSVSICLDILMEQMSYIDALEHFHQNISGAYVGDKTPVWCFDNF